MCHNDMIVIYVFPIFILDKMNFFFILVLFLGLLPLLTNTIRCYKCDATSECKTISSRTDDYSSDNVEVIDCDYYCWKSISLGK
jgi:hypothetical protein